MGVWGDAMSKSQCTMKDVAQVVGVSTYTVSRALNGKKDVSEQLRQKILRVSREMGYVPNVAARGLQAGRTRTVAIVLDDLQNMYYNILLTKLTRKFNSCGYHVTFYYEWDSISTLNEKLMQRVLSSSPDGIVSFLRTDSRALQLNKIWKRPLAVIGAREDDPDTDCIYYDDERGGAEVTRYLLGCGCRRIGFINASTKLLPGTLRCEGYKKALTEAGIPVDPSLIVHLEDRGQVVGVAVRELAEKGADGIFCFSDMTALSALWSLMGTKYENKIRIAGWDNIEKEIHLPCRFVTVGADYDRLVDDAVDILIRRMNGEVFDTVKKMFPVCLVDGD